MFGQRKNMVSEFKLKVWLHFYLNHAVDALIENDAKPTLFLVDKAAYEFAETETMLLKAEELCGPYVWGIYDILVLPPSFPYGGMENPCLTFATPTLLVINLIWYFNLCSTFNAYIWLWSTTNNFNYINVDYPIKAGDRSLANVIAHEIAHSWTGNLVTNYNFEHFWLNEGFTVFTERKIAGRMEGEASRHFGGLNGWKDLKEEVGELLFHLNKHLLISFSGRWSKFSGCNCTWNCP